MNQEDPESREQYEPIQEIIDHRKKQEEKIKKRIELDKLKAEREELQIAYNTRREKERIEALRNKLDGKVFCDDCSKWVYPEHFK